MTEPVYTEMPFQQLFIRFKFKPSIIVLCAIGIIPLINDSNKALLTQPGSLCSSNHPFYFIYTGTFRQVWPISTFDILPTLIYPARLLQHLSSV